MVINCYGREKATVIALKRQIALWYTTPHTRCAYKNNPLDKLPYFSNDSTDLNQTFRLHI